MSGFLGYLDALFGAGASNDPIARAAQSDRLFVRSIDLLVMDDSPQATGRRLTALEALETYGLAKLVEIVEEGAAVISSGTEAAGRTLRQRREQLGLEVKTAANAAGLTQDAVRALEDSRRRPVREYEKLARVLALDERLLSFLPEATGGERIAVRLRSLADERTSLPPSSVIAIAEATWVATTQMRLEVDLGLNATTEKPQFKPEADYGGPGHPPFRIGYSLADDFRRAMEFGHAPIPSMRDLAEDTLGIPVVQTALNLSIAGATVEVGESRAIVLNLDGPNSDPMVRRSTVAHELCHLLFDPPRQLQDLRVDEYNDLDRAAESRADPVEQRANAFAVQLLAPQEAAVQRYRKSDGDLHGAVLDHFGLSFTAGRYQVWNGLNRTLPLLEVGSRPKSPEHDWDGRESFTTSYHPINSLMKTPSRAGRFSAVALRGALDGLISWDTAATWLYTDEHTLREALPWMRELYPTVLPVPS
jgi:Zn-dependent peptidase ImmA (M78 family)/transcriptional regulator with XRE-family HTH domain